MPYKMSEGPNENYKFYANNENYENCENSQTTEKVSNILEGPNENCEIYENYENYDNCEKFAKIAEGTNEYYENDKKSHRHEACLGRFREAQRELRNFQKLRELRELRNLQRSQRDPMRITKTAKIHFMCRRVPTRTASFMKITRITKIANIHKDL